MDNATPTPTPPINITSQNQSGGFTGLNQGTINFKDPPWGLLTARKDEMIATLKASPKQRVGLWVMANDSVSEFMGNNVAALLKDGGIEFETGHVFWAPQLRGILIQIGPNDPEAKKQGETIKQALKLGGIEAAMVEKDGNANAILIVVGVRP